LWLVRYFFAKNKKIIIDKKTKMQIMKNVSCEKIAACIEHLIEQESEMRAMLLNTVATADKETIEQIWSKLKELQAGCSARCFDREETEQIITEIVEFLTKPEIPIGTSACRLHLRLAASYKWKADASWVQGKKLEDGIRLDVGRGKHGFGARKWRVLGVTGEGIHATAASCLKSIIVKK
jgi:hypothetical protein